MYNTDLPRRADLPSSSQLKRSTIIAAISAAALLLTVVLPSEYGIDPTRVGRLFGLTEMGQIKTQLAKEAADDAAAAAPSAAISPDMTARLDRIEKSLVVLEERLGDSTAATGPRVHSDVPEPAVPAAQTVEEIVAEPEPVAEEIEQVATIEQPVTTKGRQDEVSFRLSPGQGIEVKLVMEADAEASFYWTANGAVVNYDTHDDGGGQKISYEKGRGVSEQEGTLKAAFTGNHGWFWRNRSDADLTLTLRTNGDYSDIKRM